MGFLSWVQESLIRNCHFLINQGVFSPSEPNSKEANILFLGKDVEYKRAVKRNFDVSIIGYEASWVSCIGSIKFNFFDLGGHEAARKASRDHFAKMDAVVYIVDVDIMIWNELPGLRRELNALLSDENFANVPFLILGTTRDVSTCSENDCCSLLHLTNVTTGKGNVELAANVRPLEVFVAESYYSKQYLDGFKWLSQYI
nr:GTP-binding protein SAR2-like [Quercus suber]POE59450.1 gtp-binding protein sar2 [Quercus suber]